MNTVLDHGGRIDAAAIEYGGNRDDWLDLSTGINPVPYSIPELDNQSWAALPDELANQRLLSAARRFWNVPDQAAIIAVPGASAAIANIPRLRPAGTAYIPGPTYNEHRASFQAAGWSVAEKLPAQACVFVHPNNPDGRVWNGDAAPGILRIIDESFCDIMPDASLIRHSTKLGTLILKSFGKFWGLAGLRLGFVIGAPSMIGELTQMLGPWPVSGPALNIGTAALNDQEWADKTRQRLVQDAERLDDLMKAKGAKVVGGTTLFRLYRVDDAASWQDKLARHHIWSRIFPYDSRWIRLGLPAPSDWHRVEQALS